MALNAAGTTAQQTDCNNICFVLAYRSILVLVMKTNQSSEVEEDMRRKLWRGSQWNLSCEAIP